LGRILRWTIALAYFALLTFLLLTPRLPYGAYAFLHLFRHADKVAHFFALGFLGVMIARALSDPAKASVRGLTLLVTIVVTAFYAVAVEFIQPHFHRTFEVLDMVDGVLGVLVFLFAWVGLRKRIRILA
jgi:VanZ family protein